MSRADSAAGVAAMKAPEGEQTFELSVDEVITVTGITAPIEVGAVGGVA